MATGLHNEVAGAYESKNFGMLEKHFANPKVITCAVAALKEAFAATAEIPSATDVASCISAWHASFAKIVSDYYDMNTRTEPSKLRRASMEVYVQVPEDTQLKYCGTYFTFVNREETCKQLLRCFYDVEEHRRAGGCFQRIKRDINIPLCTGIPGIGKSRFARIAAVHLTQCALNTPMAQLITKAANVSQLVWPDDSDEEHTMHTEFIQSVLRATRERNLCIELDTYAVKDGQVTQNFAYALLIEWLKGFARTGKHMHLSDEEVTYILMLEFRKHALPATIMEVLDFIIKSAKTDEDLNPSMLINIDEAHVVTTEELQGLLQPLLRAVVDAKLRVFVSVTGVHQEIIDKGFMATGINSTVITLPLLEEEHMKKVLAHFFGVGEEALPPAFVSAVWWMGGVPRFLQYFLEALGTKSGTSTVSALWLWCKSPAATPLAFTDAIAICAEKAFGRCISKKRVSKQVLSNIFTLALAGVTVSPETSLDTTTAPGFTVAEAESHQLVYLSQHGTLSVPPMILHKLHAIATTAAGPLVSSFREPSAALTSDENEFQTVSLIMHRLKAFSILGQNKVRLGSLLGGLALHHTVDVEVTIPKNFSVESLDHQVGSANAAKFFDVVRKGARERPDETVVAFQNGEHATYSDGFVVFPEAVLHVQGKQKISERRQAVRGLATHAVSSAAILKEYSYVTATGPHQHLFLYVDDADPNPDAGVLPKEVVVITRNLHQQAFGHVGKLRAFAVADSTVRAGSMMVKTATGLVPPSRRREGKCVIL